MMEKITIVGTGLAGLTAAYALARYADVTLIGPEPGSSKDGRTTAILSPGVDLLSKLGLWKQVASHAVPLMTMELIDHDTSFAYDASETDRNEFGFNVPNDLLKQALVKAVKTTKNVFWIKENVIHAERKSGAWSLTLENKKKHTASLIIAADGRNSMMRGAAGIAVETKEDDQTALVVILEASQSHHYTSVEWYRDGGPLTLVPMEGKKLAVVWCENDATARDYAQKSLSELSKILTSITENRFGRLAVLTKPQAWPIRVMKAERLVKDNVILIGEAGHTLPPIGAQGFNASLHDLTTLSDLFERAVTLGLNFETFLPSYQQTRMTDIALRYHSMTQLNNLIRASHPAFRMLRRTGLRLLDRVTPLRRRVMSFGMGSDKGHAA